MATSTSTRLDPRRIPLPFRRRIVRPLMPSEKREACQSGLKRSLGGKAARPRGAVNRRR